MSDAFVPSFKQPKRPADAISRILDPADIGLAGKPLLVLGDGVEVIGFGMRGDEPPADQDEFMRTLRCLADARANYPGVRIVLVNMRLKVTIDQCSWTLEIRLDPTGNSSSKWLLCGVPPCIGRSIMNWLQPPPAPRWAAYSIKEDPDVAT